MMHTAQMLIGSAFVAGLASLVASPFLPSAPPIQVHSLQFDGSQMVQARTVITDGDKFFAKWQAQIENAETGEIVCKGDGSWNYEAGTMDAKMSLERWVGDDGCSYASLPSGSYRPVATWHWGSDQISHTGEVFEK